MSSDSISRLTHIEQRLPRPLPEAYRQWLLDDTAVSDRFIPFTLADPNWESTVESFLREWHPLNNHLFPVDYCGEGIFACLHLCEKADRAPVIAWDIAADLGEQPFVALASTWDAYRPRREKDGWQPLEEVLPHARSRRLMAARELDDNLAGFDHAVKRFHEDYVRRHDGQRFEHHADNAIPRDKEWKPERLAVQDHLLGVMAYCYNPELNSVDVIGFATRDHTNFARGSATAGLLTGLLCEWASKGAEGIRFLSVLPGKDDPWAHAVKLMTPYEVALLGWVLGAGVRPRQNRIEAEQAEKIFLELTPFPPAIRHRIGTVANIARACLNIHRQIWSPLEIALLAEWCPKAAVIFGGDLDVGEQTRFTAFLYHARAAALVGFGYRMIETAAETREETTPSFELLTGDPALAYAVVFRIAFQTEWRKAGRRGTDMLTVPSDRPLVLVGIPEPGPFESIHSWAETFRALVMERFSSECVILGIVPDRTDGMNSRIPFEIVAADEDSGMLDVAAQNRFMQSRRIRS